jgi:transposase-like protein
MTATFQTAIFNNEDKAREALEAVRWPDGPVCPHCGATGDDVAKVEGNKHRPGLYYCNACEGQFTVTVGTVFERSKIPLSKWWLAVHLLNSSKKGFSAHQLHRTLKVTYKTAWFMMHRIREAMRTGGLAPMGGTGHVVEIDETVIGKLEGAPKRTYQGYGQQWRNVVMSLVTRGGSVRSFHIEGTTSAQVLPIIKANLQTETFVMTDEGSWYRSLGETFTQHEAVNHSAKEYVRRDFSWHTGKLTRVKISTNTVEGYFSIFKRGMKGVYQHCSEKHLHRYLAEFDFRYNHRIALGYNDGERAALAMKGIEGKRLTYRPTNGKVSQGRGAQIS